MSGEDDDSNACVVCFKDVEFYSLGQCDHPVCFECSTRMRVLCQQTECPICRQDMPKVIFVDEVLPFKNLKETSWERKYKIGFCSAELEAAYRRLLQHCCRVCQGRQEFRTFGALKDHMRREHELFYCDLCVDNLKIFSSERRCYKRAELGQHRRRGDSDDRSHRGHPLCEFCDERFMDNDELFRHLRRNHLFCHFCDADGYHRYFGSYDYLREHFRSEHYLCEEGDCKDEKFTSVYRSDIDLKAHRASVHGRALGKAATKQARTLELEFTLAPRPRGNAATQRRPSPMEEVEGAVGYSTQPPVNPSPDTRCIDHFPSLSGGNDPLPSGIGGRKVQYHGKSKFSMNEENFPALHGQAAGSNQTVNISLQRGTSQRPMSNNLSIKVKHGPRQPEPVSGPPLRGLADFPSLGASTPALSLGASSWKGTVAPKSANVAKLPEKFAKSCNTKTTTTSSGSSKVSVKPSVSAQSPTITSSGSSKVSVKPSAAENSTNSSKTSKVSVRPPTPAQNSNPVASKSSTSSVSTEAKDPKPENSKAKKKKNKGQTNSSSPTSKPSSAAQPSRPKPSLVEERKCSELNIGELKEEKQTTPRAPPAPSLGPPPGFDTPISNNHTTSPPPGFSVTLNSVARPTNGLTFTNSCGESFPIRQAAGVFQQPTNFDQRNAALVQGVSKALQQKKDSGGLAIFRQLSSKFRQGSIEASEYYEQCSKAMGAAVFSELFPELLALLPDIRKQQELWRAHGRKGELEECKTCGQVVRSSDARAHSSSHMLDSHFPALSDNTPPNRLYCTMPRK